MKTNNLFKLSVRTFKTRTGRTFLTIFGISIGISAILFFVSLGYGLQEMMLRQVTTSDSILSLDVTVPDSDIIDLSQERIDELSRINNVEEISPLAVVPGQISLNNLSSDTYFGICNPSYFRLNGVSPMFGEFFKENDTRKVVLSSALVRSFGLDPTEAVGKNLNLMLFKLIDDETGEIQVFQRQEPYEIVGIIEQENAGYAYLPFADVQDLGITDYIQLKVKVTKADALIGVRDEILNKGFLVSALSETVNEANKIFQVLQVFLATFGLVALFVAAIGTVNTMTITLLERTNEIGTMKAIGGKDGDIGKMFLIESVIIGFLGGIGGIIVSFILTTIVNHLFNMVALEMGGEAVSLFYTPLWLFIFILVFSLFVGFLSGLYPSRKAAKMSPLDALRYK